MEDKRLGEEIFCCIRLRDCKSISHQEVVEHCEGKIAKYKIPKFIDIVTDFPRTTSGKIQKHKLVEMYNSGIDKSK